MRRIATHAGYIAAAPKEARDQLRAMRDAIHKACPEAEEVFSYQMPAFRYGGILCWYAFWAKHVSFFPTAEGMKKFARELKRYDHNKGTIRFKFGEKIPVALLQKIVKYRVQRMLEED